jgi:hypothetical protein
VLDHPKNPGPVDPPVRIAKEKPGPLDKVIKDGINPGPIKLNPEIEKEIKRNNPKR